MTKDIRSLRSTIDYLIEKEEVLVSEIELGPALELAAIQKHFDGGPPLLFNKVKGYPNSRLFTNLFADAERVLRLFDGEDSKRFKLRILNAIQHPIRPREIKDAVCQEVITDRDIDVWPIIPMISHTPADPGRTLGGGNTLIIGEDFWGGSHIGFNRMYFRGPNYSSFQISPGSHMDMVVSEFRKKGRIPMTINMGVPPACTLMAGAGFTYFILPKGCDELGIAGAIQGSPVDIVRARTVDAYSIANSEYVIEGYLDMEQKVWESELAERDQKQGIHPFHPEWSGYMGRAYRTFKFVATAITYREDRPIYYPLISHGYDPHNLSTMIREAAFFELAERICPGLCVDTHIPMSMNDWGGVIFQVRKRRLRDEGFQRNILSAALSSSQGARLAIAVDTDVNIYETDDILWALATRLDAATGIMVVAPGGAGQTFQPLERSMREEREGSRFSGAIALDATVPFQHKDSFQRAKYPIDFIDPTKWFTEQQIARGKKSQKPYAKYLSKVGI